MSGPGPAEEATGVLHRPPASEPEDGAVRAGPRRFWSARRVPAGLLALLLLVIVAAFLYDIVAVRADRPAMSWRRKLAGQLAGRPLDDLWVLLGAGAAVLLGIWLLLLALTPGLRSLLAMHRTRSDVRAGLDRDAAATVLRDRAVGIAGVRSVRVRVTRKRADVRAVSHFRELDDVRADLRMVLADAVGDMALSRPPTLVVRVRRPGRKG